MKKADGMTNVQNIPGNNDFDDRPGSEEDRIREKDNRQTPPDKEPFIVPVDDPLYQKDKKPIDENPREPQRIMSSSSVYERRIF